jgi:hypothetical protein
MDETLEQDILDLFWLQQGDMSSVIVHQLVEVVNQLWNTTDFTETFNDPG